MHIDPKSTLYGHPALVVRQILRQFPDGFGTDGDYGTRVIQDKKERRKLLKQLLADGLLEPFCVGMGYSCTQKGTRLAGASGRTINRATAQKMLTALVGRAHKINANPDYCYSVSTLVVFGSFLKPEVGALGDLDIGYALERKYAFDGPEEKRSRQRARPNASWFDCLTWPETEVSRALKARTPGLSLHPYEIDKGIILGGPHKFLLGAPV